MKNLGMSPCKLLPTSPPGAYQLSSTILHSRMKLMRDPYSAQAPRLYAA